MGDYGYPDSVNQMDAASVELDNAMAGLRKAAEMLDADSSQAILHQVAALATIRELVLTGGVSPAPTDRLDAWPAITPRHHLQMLSEMYQQLPDDIEVVVKLGMVRQILDHRLDALRA